MAVRHAVVTLQRVVRRDDASAGTLQWQTVFGTHSPTRIGISVESRHRRRKLKWQQRAFFW
ncbi:hypothetical protein M885DRAFT_543203, partial [Pelagophyceae sp. CCMP2097]